MKAIISSVIGPIGIQVVGLIFVPLIANLYGPEYYGLMNILLSYVAVLTPLCTGCYAMAIVLPKKKRRAEALAAISAWATLILVSLIFIVSALAHVLVKDDHTKSVLAWLPIAVLFSTVWSIHNYCLVREKRFLARSVSQIIQTSLTGLVRVATAFAFTPTPIWLMSTSALSNALNSILCEMIPGGRGSRIKVNIRMRASYLKKVAYKYADFPKYRLPQVLISTATQAMPITIIASIYGASAAGCFGLARTLVVVTTNSISQSISDVLYGKYSKISIPSGIRKSMKIDTLIMFSGSCFTIAPFALIAPALAAILFNETWDGLGHFIAALAVMQIFAISARPAFAAAPALGKQKSILITEVLFTGLKLTAMAIAHNYQDSALSVVIGYAIGTIASYFASFIIIAAVGRGK